MQVSKTFNHDRALPEAMKTIKLARFPRTKHMEGDEPACIAAAIENVVRYHGGKLSHEDICRWCIDRHGGMDDIDLEKTRQILEENCNDDLAYTVIDKRTCNAIKSEEDLLGLARRAIDLDSPVIVEMNFPSCLYLPSYSTASERYVLTILGASENHVMIWDTNPGVLSLPIVVSKEWMADHMVSRCTSLWIIPRERESDVEALCTE